VSWRAAVAIGVAVALVTWLGYRSVRPPTPGPLARDAVESLGIQRRVGETFTYGLPVVFNSGDEAAVLTRIEPVDPSPGLQVVHTRIGGSERELFAFSSGRWPDPELFTDLHPVPGFIVQPQRVKGWERGVQLIFVLRADDPGRYEFDTVAVDYRVGDNEHPVLGLGVCVTEGRRMPNDRSNDPPSLDSAYAFKEVAVEYRVGGREHRAVLEIGLGVCVTKGRKLPNRRCKRPPSMDFDAALTPPA
jgi:hypothetical protein